ncbi:nucleotide exchange factor GrpE [Listeria newyorkensis]|uniref:Protein GrpE n=1 Tax=Listeria newyorkensis TaxID=1497681 RepID=A0ABX4XJ97_9LIST|nr:MULTISPECIES: nucleotide exchange factor GrpE [Listeria]KGL45333.1 heat shock protein GrpE [Listeriaceae bacterium FSL A5-0209]KGL43138.1 heat shock protein GrpE [Listeria newyorkensis]KMT59330.1 heat shock protein GrpE [Listeria newyorkensis]PNP88303.1 nucleotide exchange factor GrpE [Listeria newyorkensis]RQW68035.1 nucleotide exchange factor GrpE [Listeria sp. SHR_NRA_18]
MSEQKNKKEKVAQEIEKEAAEELNVVEEEMEAHNEQVEVELTENEKRLLELEEKLAASEDRYLRLQADFENVKKRNVAERVATQKYRSQTIAEELLPALDGFQKALDTQSDSEQMEALLTGMKMVYGQIMTALEKEGVEAIPALGEQFDPNFHQAVMQDSDDSKESNEITMELQKGYKLKDRVIRPSMVKVNQ